MNLLDIRNSIDELTHTLNNVKNDPVKVDYVINELDKLSKKITSDMIEKG